MLTRACPVASRFGSMFYPAQTRDARSEALVCKRAAVDATTIAVIDEVSCTSSRTTARRGSRVPRMRLLLKSLIAFQRRARRRSRELRPMERFTPLLNLSLDLL